MERYGLVPRTADRHQVRQLVTDGAQLVEVLSRGAYEREHIAGAISLPLGELGTEARKRLDAGRPVVVYCYDPL